MSSAELIYVFKNNNFKRGSKNKLSFLPVFMRGFLLKKIYQNKQNGGKAFSKFLFFKL
jgi:hypothetical protein